MRTEQMVIIPPRKSFAQLLSTNRAEGGVNVVPLSKHRERPYQAGRSKH
jgi:hypothetical protein